MKIFLPILLIISFSSVAKTIPRGSIFDSRIQNTKYNAKDVVQINTKLGYVTTIIFSSNETIEHYASGFEAGWSLTKVRNKLFISPRAVEQNNDENIPESFAPNAQDWQTNLFVATNKRNYSFDLTLSKSKIAHIVNFNYDEDQLTTKNILQRESKFKNYNYFFKSNSLSKAIVPDFTYDDGKSTYFGFSVIKDLPTLFLMSSGKEQMTNYSIEQKDNFKVIRAHHLSQRFILRYGQMAVGILNKSFGQYVQPLNLTVSPDITKIEAQE